MNKSDLTSYIDTLSACRLFTGIDEQNLPAMLTCLDGNHIHVRESHIRRGRSSSLYRNHPYRNSAGDPWRLLWAPKRHDRSTTQWSVCRSLLLRRSFYCTSQRLCHDWQWYSASGLPSSSDLMFEFLWFSQYPDPESAAWNCPEKPCVKSKNTLYVRENNPW